MLSEQDCQLLTAYVDGELDERRRQAVLRLVQTSEEARALLGRLERDAAALRALPHMRLEDDFADRMLRRAGEHGAVPGPASRPGRRKHVAALAAAAAAVVVLASVARWVYFGRPDRKPAPQGHELAVAREPATARQRDERGPVELLGGGAGRPEAMEAPSQGSRRDAPPALEREAKSKTAPAPMAESAAPEAPRASARLAAGVAPSVQAGVPFKLSLDQMGRPGPRDRLRESMQQGHGCRLELTCADRSAGFQQVQAALEASGVRLLVEPGLRAAGFRDDFVVYVEDLRPPELAGVLERLGRPKGQGGAGVFGRVAVMPLTAAEQKRLSEVTGVDCTRVPPPRAKAPSGVDIHRPLSEGTAGEVVRSMAGEGARRGASGGARPAPGGTALVLAYAEDRKNAASLPEVKRFLDGRTEHRPGSAPVFLVVRQSDRP